MLPLNLEGPMRTESPLRSAAQKRVALPSASGALNNTTSATCASDMYS